MKRGRGVSGYFNPEGFGLLAERANVRGPKADLNKPHWPAIVYGCLHRRRLVRDECSLMFVVDDPLEDGLLQLAPLLRSSRMVSVKA